jgi:hypothetical protein
MWGQQARTARLRPGAQPGCGSSAPFLQIERFPPNGAAKRQRRLMRVSAVLVGAAVSGCAADWDWRETAMVVPGYYDTLECRDLNAQITAQSKRVKELSSLIEKAGDGFGGTVASGLAYQTDLARARAGKQAAERAANRKGCDPADKSGSAAPPPAPAPPPSLKPMAPGH